MSELTTEQYEELPDFAKSQYVKDGEGYSHKGMLKVKQTANDLDNKLKDVNGKLEEFSKTENERIEAAKREAYEKAKAENDIEGVESRWKEKFEDLERRSGETKKQYEERLEKLASKSVNAVATTLASIATDIGKAAFIKLVKDRIKVDPETDEVTYLDDEGRATSLDEKAFIDELKKDVMFMPLIKSDIVTDGGGQANGSSGGRATKKPSEMTSAERIQFKQRDPEGFKQAFNL